MRVLVTGATGFLGSAAADALHRAGHTVLGLARSKEAAAGLAQRGITPVSGDLREPEGLAAAAERSEGVLHAATTGDGDADGRAIRALLEALAGTGRPFVYTSGTWIYGDTGGRVADEGFPLSPSPYTSWRPVVEDLVFSFARHGVRTSIMRPAIAYGRGGGIPGSMVEDGRETGVVRMVGSGENRWPLLHVDAYAALAVALLGRAEPGTVVNAANDSAVPLRDVAEGAARAAGIPGRVESWPLAEARAHMGPLADALAMDQQVSSELARRLFGWSPSGPGLLEELREGSYAPVS